MISGPARYIVDMTDGTSGCKDTLEIFTQSGVGTIVGRPISEDHRKEAEKHHIHVVIDAHIASDTLGINLLLDTMEKRSPLTVVECAGFKRTRRQS
jgi:hypothetical protein